MSFHRERNRAIIRRDSRRKAGDQEEVEEENDLEQLGSPRHVMSADDPPERRDQLGAATKGRGGQVDHSVYEQQLEQLQAQLEATMIDKMEMESTYVCGGGCGLL